MKSKLKRLVPIFGQCVRSTYFAFRDKFKQYPKVIQLPITYQCNSKCVMCNIWKMDYSNEVSPQELEQILSDELFKEVRSVGINGGEPTLKKNLPEYARAVLTLPKITALNIITHGFNQKQLLTSCEEIKKGCEKKGVSFHISVSLDGYDDIHNKVRGMPVFKITSSSIDKIREKLCKYANSMDVGCTVVRQNVDHLVELDAYAKKEGIDIKYRLGIPNKRIESDILLDQFTVRTNKTIQSAKEFFHSKFDESLNESKSISDIFKYYAIFYHLVYPNKRLLGCDWQHRGVTLDSKGKLFYCAVESEEIGDTRKRSASLDFFDPKNMNYRNDIVSNKCDGCIHDYTGDPKVSSVILFIKGILFHRFWPKLYKLRVSLPW